MNQETKVFRIGAGWDWLALKSNFQQERKMKSIPSPQRRSSSKLAPCNSDKTGTEEQQGYGFWRCY